MQMPRMEGFERKWLGPIRTGHHVYDSKPAALDRDYAHAWLDVVADLERHTAFLTVFLKHRPKEVRYCTVKFSLARHLGSKSMNFDGLSPIENAPKDVERQCK